MRLHQAGTNASQGHYFKEDICFDMLNSSKLVSKITTHSFPHSHTSYNAAQSCLIYVTGMLK
jgi:hypothetical protein